MVECRLEYDLLSAGYDTWWFPAWGLGGLGFMLVVIFFIWLVDKNRLSAQPFMVIIPICGALVWSVGAFAGTYLEFRSFSNTYRQGGFKEVIGDIENYIPQDLKRKGSEESFKVGGLVFAFSRFTPAAGFGRLQAHGSPLRNGLRVRIRYIGNRIVRVEIC